MMNSYSTHNDVTALEFGCCRSKKQEEAEKTAGAPGVAIAEPVLNEPRNPTSTPLQPHFNHIDTSKTTLNNTTKKEKTTTIKERITT
jgi:hypothetical protein